MSDKDQYEPVQRSGRWMIQALRTFYEAKRERER